MWHLNVVGVYYIVQMGDSCIHRSHHRMKFSLDFPIFKELHSFKNNYVLICKREIEREISYNGNILIFKRVIPL